MGTELAEIRNIIYIVREQKVMLDADLARLYEVETKMLNRAVKRNIERFPDNFMFQLSEEEWKIYPRDNKYEVSKNGKVRLANNHKLVGALSTTGYMIITNQKIGQPTEYYRIHRMVMETFNPIENSEMYVVDHIDGNKQNNDISNLRWVLQRQNIQFRDENWAEINQNLQKLIEKKGYDWVNRLLLLEIDR